MDAVEYVRVLATAARSAAGKLGLSPGRQRDAALLACAGAIRQQAAALKAENAKDLSAARSTQRLSTGRAQALPPAMIDRLTLNDKTIAAMAAGLEAVAAQPDPVGQTIAAYARPSGLRVEKRRVPLGVVAVIYESRPNVTADAAALCLKSGNACILRGGKEALNSNLAIGRCIKTGLAEAGLPESAVTVIDRTEHEIVGALASAEGLIDLIIPRGGEKLIRAVVQVATVPVIKHYTGNCHVYVDASADAGMARRIVLNAKCQRPGICNAAETLLVHAVHAAPGGLLALILEDLLKAGVEIRGDARTLALLASAEPRAKPGSPKVRPAAEADWYAEYLDLILAVGVVDSLESAIEHVNKYGSRHTDAIVTDSVQAAEAFVAGVDSSSVMVNASTRLSDGAEYGLGAEVGISTDKLHARGPMGAEDLTTYKWIVTGAGHVRE
jgi:glutamate-5-semialdehyde dehydrogenase